ncbi:MAG: hypothetical protein IKR52_01060 [Paludibacteraceae bacterium]|nr:hypothetical protein [Paludibacteraceae bacterium]
MRIKQILFLVFGLLCYACGRHANNASAADFGQQIEETSLFLVADTIHDGGLQLLHHIVIVDVKGEVLFVDSTEDYEPDPCKAVMWDEEHRNGYIILRQFSPCDDAPTLILRTDGHRILFHCLASADSVAQGTAEIANP